MSKSKPVEYAKASREVRAVFDDIKATRNVPDVNNFWKYLARDPALLKRTWESIKEVMAPGALDPVVKEMIYLAVSVTNGCGYCIASHGAARAQGRHDGGDVRRADGGGRHGQRDQPPGQRLSRADRRGFRQMSGGRLRLATRNVAPVVGEKLPASGRGRTWRILLPASSRTR